MTHSIRGSKPLKQSKEQLGFYRELGLNQQITIIRFSPPEGELDPIQLAKYEAARFSTEHKVKTFTALGCKVNQHYLDYYTSPNEFQAILKQANDDSVGIIVQNPFADRLQSSLKLIDCEKDLDGMRGDNPYFSVSATSETIFRIVEPFVHSNDIVAVVGAKGFVGGGVVKLLEEQGINTLGLDYGDDLLQTRTANIVVSATGVPELLDERHIIPEHRLVVDAGFIPLADSPILGDVNRSAYDIPQNITPVPGGVGPFQMATLMERLVTQVTGKDIEPWQCPIPSEKEQSITPKNIETPEQIWERYQQSINIEEPSKRIQAITSQMFLDGVSPEIAKAGLEAPPSLEDEPEKAQQIVSQAVDQLWGEMNLKINKVLKFAKKIVSQKGKRVGEDQIFEGKNYIIRQSRAAVSIEAKDDRGVLLSGNDQGYTLSGFSRRDLQQFDKWRQRSKERQRSKARRSRKFRDRDFDFER